MNTIYKRSSEIIGEKRDWVATKHGSTDIYEAVEQMAILCGQSVAAIQKQGKRCTIDAGNWDGRLVMRVVNNHKIIESYSIIKI